MTEGREGKTLLHCHAGCGTETILQALGLEMGDLFVNVPVPNANGHRHAEVVATYEYVDADGSPVGRVFRLHPKSFRQQHRCPSAAEGWGWGLGGNPERCPCPRMTFPLYRLDRAMEAVGIGKVVYITEGEKDVHAIEAAGGTAATNAGGAGKWRTDHALPLRGAHVVVVADTDAPGREHAHQVAHSLVGVAASVRIVHARTGKDAADHLEAGHSLEDFAPLNDSEAGEGSQEGHDRSNLGKVTPDDFWAYLPEHKYIFRPTRELWPGASVDARLPPQIVDGEQVRPSKWLDLVRPVEQMTWWPGEPEVIEGRLISSGGWIPRPGCRTYNLYRPPVIEPGRADEAGPWLDHIHRVFPDNASHLIAWLAHRVQRPGEKVNHAIVLQGPQGTGKDSILAGVIPAVGPWNVSDVSPDQLLGRFNSFLKSVILRVSEARDLGDVDRYRLYDHLKVYTAAPPDLLRCDEKNVREYAVPNVCAVVITSNYTDGIYLPPDDRRHYVAATELTRTDFEAEYFRQLYGWYEREGGYAHVAAYLLSVDLSAFDPKAPPPKTAAFWNVVDAGRAPEDAELADALDRLLDPQAVTLEDLAHAAGEAFANWLKDRRNSRQIPHRLEAVGYVAVRNEAAKDGKWKVRGRRQVIYARRDLSTRDRIGAARAVAEAGR